MKLAMISENDELKRVPGSLIGLRFGSQVITEKTKNQVWQREFDCSHENLTSLKGSPKEVKGTFNCGHNKLTSLEGAPSIVDGHFVCRDNYELTSLEGVHKIIKEIKGVFYAHHTKIKSHVLGLLLIKGIRNVELDDQEVENILNKYLPNHKGNSEVFACQNELIDKGFDEYAQL